MMSRKAAILAAVLVVGLSGLGWGNLIQNGSFEVCQAGYEPRDPGGWGVLVRDLPAGMGSVDYWTIGLANNWGMFYWYWASSGGINAQDGSRFMNLTSGSGQTTFESVSQSFGVSAGVTYTVSYYRRYRVSGASLRAEILLGAGSASGTLSQVVSPGSSWGQSSFSFTPDTSTTATLKFSQASWSTGLDNGVFLDNVSVTGSADLLVTLANPTQRRVFQRDGDNVAQVPVTGSYMGTATRVEARAVVMAGFSGVDTGWQVVATGPTGGSFSGALAVQAGGWYRIEAQAYNGETSGPVAVVEKVGVGEVFITAGQSNSANYGTPALTPTHDTVSAWMGGGNGWRHGYDPQPYATGTGGSAWSRLGDLLADQLGVPIGFMSTGVGATRVDEWMPGAAYYPKLQAAISGAGSNGFRSFLWHQGESDSLASTSASVYASRLNTIIAQTRVDAGWSAPWGVALASYHPSSTPAQEAQVRQGQQMVIAGDELVYQGADTDNFGSLGYLHDGVHFNGAGLLAHAQQWQGSVVANLFVCDMNLDGVVDMEDLSLFGGQWLKTSFTGGDFNGDSQVNLKDLAVFSENWLR